MMVKGRIVQLKNRETKQNEYPYTYTQAVIGTNGKNLESELTDLRNRLTGLDTVANALDKSLKDLEKNIPVNISQLVNDSGYLTEVNKEDVGLDQVDNTSDLNKPVSRIQQEEFEKKQEKLVSGLNISTINGTSLLEGGDIKIEGSGGGGVSLEYNKPISPISITGEWAFYDNSDNPVKPENLNPRPDLRNPTLEIGYKAVFEGTWKWNKSDDTTKKPVGISDGSNWTDLPENNVPSSIYESPKLTSNTVVKIKVYSPKTGLIVENQNVVPAKGNDYKETSVQVYFRYRVFYGVSKTDEITEEIIKSLSTNYLTSSRSKTISGVSTGEDEYFIYTYPETLGQVSSIIQDGATPVIGAFRILKTDVTNEAGKTIKYNVYITNNKGSFTNASLKIT